MSFVHGPELRDAIERNLAEFDRRVPPAEGLTRAAVSFVVVGNDAGEASFVLTRRTSRLRNHGGQWSLPGGRVESGEDAVEAALRELEEEVGLTLQTSSVVGFLDDFRTRSGFVITPLVVWGPERAEISPDPREVAAAYVVPLSALTRPGVPRFIAGPESDRPLVTIPLEDPDTVVYAPTAALIYQAREVALEGRATRVEGLGEPTWAWQ